MSIHIRPATLSDSKELSDLILENAKVTLMPHYSDEQFQTFSKYYSPEEVAKKINTQTVFCAQRNGEIVGTSALLDDFVLGFYTRVQNLNEGIGKLLLAHLEQHAFSNGIT